MRVSTSGDVQMPRREGKAEAVVVENLVKTYPPDVRAVDTISFSVGSGEIFGLLGRNGAGKTTTIKMIIGLTKPTAGSLRILRSGCGEVAAGNEEDARITSPRISQ